MDGAGEALKTYLTSNKFNGNYLIILADGQTIEVVLRVISGR